MKSLKSVCVCVYVCVRVHARVHARMCVCLRETLRESRKPWVTGTDMRFIWFILTPACELCLVIEFRLASIKVPTTVQVPSSCDIYVLFTDSELAYFPLQDILTSHFSQVRPYLLFTVTLICMFPSWICMLTRRAVHLMSTLLVMLQYLSLPSRWIVRCFFIFIYLFWTKEIGMTSTSLFAWYLLPGTPLTWMDSFSCNDSNHIPKCRWWSSINIFQW